VLLEDPGRSNFCVFLLVSTRHGWGVTLLTPNPFYSLDMPFNPSCFLYASQQEQAMYKLEESHKE
jgi:hypothetical protein